MAVVKANAYGHGLLEVLSELNDAEAFAVATINEACCIRSVMPEKRIILLEGVFNHEELKAAVENRFDVVLHSEFQVQLIEQHGLSDACLAVWIKLDTGMNRLGFSVEKRDELNRRLRKLACVSEIMLMTHFLDSDDPNSVLTQKQVKLNSQLLESQSYAGYSFSNTGAVLNGLSGKEEWARIGGGLFGIKTQINKKEISIKPVMQLSANIIALKHVDKGQSVGYCASYQAPKNMCIAIVGIGYADGYPWHSAAMGSDVLIHTVKCPVVGRVSMDMLAVDVSHLEHLQEGDSVVLWGEGLPVYEVAQSLGTISYTLTCGITQRVQYIYVD